MSHSHDPALSAAAGGDRQAREDLVTTHGAVVWALCRRIASDPEDAFQDVWIHVFERLDRFDPAGTAVFSTWLHAVVHRKLIDRGRSQTRSARVISFLSRAGRSVAPSTIVGQVAAREALERGLGALTDDQRRVVLLFHCADQSLEEIARTEGVALGTIKSRLHRARATLSRVLESP